MASLANPGNTIQAPRDEWLDARGMRGVVGVLLVEHFNVSVQQLCGSARLDEDLCLDSLELLDFGLLLQDRLGITLGLDVLGMARTLQDLVDLVQASRSAKCHTEPAQHVE